MWPWFHCTFEMDLLQTDVDKSSKNEHEFYWQKNTSQVFIPNLTGTWTIVQSAFQTGGWFRLPLRTHVQKCKRGKNATKERKCAPEELSEVLTPSVRWTVSVTPNDACYVGSVGVKEELHSSACGMWSHSTGVRTYTVSQDWQPTCHAKKSLALARAIACLLPFNSHSREIH